MLKFNVLNGSQLKMEIFYKIFCQDFEAVPTILLKIKAFNSKS